MSVEEDAGCFRISKDKEKDSDGGRGESEPILPCKFSFTCNMGKSCNRRHPNTLAEPDKVLLMRLEDEAGRRLVPRWLRIKDKLMRAFGQSLREKRQKLGQVRELRLSLFISQTNGLNNVNSKLLLDSIPEDEVAKLYSSSPILGWIRTGDSHRRSVLQVRSEPEDLKTLSIRRQMRYLLLRVSS